MKKFACSLIAVFVFVVIASAQTFMGDVVCGSCHANSPSVGFFEGYMNSGHPWKIFRTEGAIPSPETWPHTPVPPLPTLWGNQVEWNDVEYVIGNYFWKTRFMDHDGYIMTGQAGENAQWNVQNATWSPYNPGTAGTFDCGSCHTTGYDPQGQSQHGMPGIIGSWAQDGIRCEACHGPGSEHVANPQVAPPGGQDCSVCHYRDSAFRMPWSGGFMKHHQQAEDMSHSPHVVLDCTTCHNPHRSTVYNDGGSISTCTQCHTGNYLVQGMEDVACVDCHMPHMGKSAISHGTYKGDVRGHIFRISTEPLLAINNTYQSDGQTYWNQDMEGQSVVTLDYACLGCHLAQGNELSLEDAAIFAADIHTNHSSAIDPAKERPTTLHLDSVYPNPFNPASTIRFRTDLPYVVRAILYDLKGKEVTVLHSGPLRAGSHEIRVDGTALPSGIYLLRLTAGDQVTTSKLTVLK